MSSAAGKISRLALGHELATTQKTYLVPSDFSQTRPRRGAAVRHARRPDGAITTSRPMAIYAFNWTPVRSNAGGLHGDANGEQLELTVDGERIKVWSVDKQAPPQRRRSAVRDSRPDPGGLQESGARVHRPEPDAE